MTTEWIAIEVIAIFVDGLTKVYFLNSRYTSKVESIAPQLLAWLILVGWGVIGTFLNFPVWLYDGMVIILVLFYLLLTKTGNLWPKIFGVVLTFALTVSSSVLGAGLASLMANVSVEHTQVNQDGSRMLAIIVIKTFQIIMFYMLSKKHFSFHALKKNPIIVLTCVVMVVLLCIMFMFFNLPKFHEQTNSVLVWLAAGLLLILIGVFVMYEIFIREESRNIDLTTQLQRLEMESHFFKELDVMLSDLRTGQHEFRNNLIALRAMIEAGRYENALEYLDKASIESFRERAMLQTGNPVLDAVVSSKLMLARSHNIETNIQAVYPETIAIQDNDLCAIIGNLLDNAIEACQRMNTDGQTRFITFSMFIKGKNLALSITNSYEGEIRRIGKKFITIKDHKFHGIGIQYVDSIIDKYQGHVLREYQDGVFETHVMLPLIQPL